MIGRRTFLGGVAAGGLCLCHGTASGQWPGSGTTYRANVKVPVGGCNLDRSGAVEFLRRYRVSKDLSDFDQDQTDAEFEVLEYLETCAIAAGEWFGVEPDFGYYQDAKGLNAFATPARMFGGREPDGSVLFGKGLLTRYLTRSNGSKTAIAVIVAHEYAHILQFKRARNGVCPEVELEADFLAGWMLGRESGVTRRGGNASSNPSAARQTLFEVGDFLFNAPGHHGTPDQRSEQVMAGYRMGRQEASLGEAWTSAIASMRA